MRERDCFIKVRLFEKEADNLKSFAEQCGLTTSELLRMMIKNRMPKPLPPEMFWDMLREFYDIHDSFKMIADSGFEASNNVHIRQKEIATLVVQLQASVTLPERYENGNNKNMGN